MGSDFKTFKLAEVSKIIAGGDKPKTFSEYKSERNCIPVLANGENNDGLLGYTDEPKIVEPAVTVSARGSKVGFTALRKQPFFPIVRLLTIIPMKERIDVSFLYYLLRQNRHGGTGSGQPQITVPDISNKSISIPNLLIQQKIASVLSVLDDKIELNNKINSELEAMVKTLYDYWFVQFDFPNADGKPYKSSGGEMVYDEVLKREIPKEWEVKIVSELAKTGSGGTPLSTNSDYYENGNIPWINSGETNNPFIIRAKNYITELGMKSSSTKLFPKNSLLMAMYGATAGKVSFLKIEATTNQAICAIIPNKKEHTYLLKFRLESMYQYLINLSTGSARDNLSQDKIKNIQIINPSGDILSKFHLFVDGLYEKYYINAKQNQELASLRDWLLPMLMNGQVTVAGAYQEVEEELAMVAEKGVEYRKAIKLDVPENRRAFAKQVLAGKIVSLFKNDPNFTHIKFQKLQFLAEHIAQADLNLNYYFQSAGPYDNKLMHTILKNFERNKWFKEQKYKFIPLEKHLQIEGYYNSYFEPVIEKLNTLYAFLENSSEAFAEIIATLYAVWNNRIIKQEDITDNLIIEDFYAWSDRKQQYTEEELVKGLKAIRENNFEPSGFGKELKRAKSKK